MGISRRLAEALVPLTVPLVVESHMVLASLPSCKPLPCFRKGLDAFFVHLVFLMPFVALYCCPLRFFCLFLF